VEINYFLQVEKTIDETAYLGLGKSAVKFSEISLRQRQGDGQVFLRKLMLRVAGRGRLARDPRQVPQVFQP
jgi:hypothetical protein